MIEPSFITDEGFLTIRAIYRLRKVLQREGKGYLRALHSRCGVGLTIEQFDNIVNNLVASQWCYIKEGVLGAKLVVFNDVFNTVNVPEVTEVSQ